MTTLDDVPFAKLLGIELESQEPGVAVLSMKLHDHHMRNGRIAHGGAVATLIDSAMAFAIIPLLGENEHSLTVDLTIHYLRPVGAVSAELFDTNEKLAATAISTYLRVISE